MNDEAYEPDSLNELPDDLRAAVELLKRRPVPEAAMQRALDRAARCGSALRWTDHRLRLQAVLGLAAAVAACIMLGLWFSRPSDVWADVVKAVQAMPWIHIHMKAVAGEDKSRETWLSFSRNIGASRDGDMVQYDDFRSGIRYEYDSQKKKLFRLSALDRGELKSLEGTFQAIFRGDATLGEDFAQHRIAKQRQRTVTEQGRRWILYEFELQGGDPKPPMEIPTISVVIRVDPENKLPDLMTLTHGKETLQLTIDYPDDGPADIYALGVPRDAPVEDRTPPPDLSRIIKILQQNRRDFGNYLAVAGGNRHSIVHVIRCKGDKFRVDNGIGVTKHVASGDEMEKWWREHGKEVLLDGSVLCDGRRVYQRSRGSPETGWKPLMQRIRQGDARAAAEGASDSADFVPAKYFVDLLAYPPRLSPEQLASTPAWTAHLDPKGENGPAGSVRVESLLARRGGPDDRRTYHKYEFWLQPKYGYAVVKHAISDCPEVDEDPLRKEKQLIYEYDDFRQTPRGVWYPTVSRYKNASQSENKNQPGGIEFHDEVTYFYLDFTSELPDELFSAGWQGDLLSGINFAPRDDQSTSKDLGKIRPPGGVPLISSGGEITVEAMNRVRQRLEAAPQEDLDKWIVELERITDKKLDSWLEKQGCRTYFVERVSVAFDGLKWNAKTADILLQRAQTMPPSEAKVWKEVFETLLNEKIESNAYFPAPYTIPLVLIPVDALHEGQKYSTERGKKYRARLKQLTADDVSLWKDKVDEFGGTRLDAAINIILLDDFFDKEKFQRDKFQAAIGARLGRSQSAKAIGPK